MNMMDERESQQGFDLGRGDSDDGGVEEDKQQQDVPGMGVQVIKAMAESVAIPGVSDDALKEIGDDITYRLRIIAQNAQKFMNHGKRTRLTCSDLDHALKVQGHEPLYGFHAREHVPFRYASGGGRDIHHLHFLEDKELDLNELVNSQLPKIPAAPSIRAHWLAIDGVQPAIPENPPPQSKDQLISDSVDPASSLKSTDSKTNKLGAVLGQTKMKTVETVNLKQLASHELSVEQQLYFKEITEACVGSDESRRAEALQSLAMDPGLHQMLPRLATFIAEGVRVNVVQHNLAILIYLMRMVKSLLENQSLILEKYLHELIPAVATCIVSRQLCTRPDHDNHWALRDFASRMMAAICKNFHTSTNNIQTRVTKIFSDALKCEKNPLVAYYGAIAGLQELGPEVIKVFILPNIKILAEKIDAALDPNNTGASSVEKNAAQNIRNLLVKSVSPVLRSMRNPPDNIEHYKTEFGSLGAPLHGGVEKARKQSGNKPSGGSGSGRSSYSQHGPLSAPRAPQPQKVFMRVIPEAQQVRVDPPVQAPVALPPPPQVVTSPLVRTVVLNADGSMPSNQSSSRRSHHY